MSGFVKILKIAGLVAGIVGLGILLGWLGTGGSQVKTSGSVPPTSLQPASPLVPSNNSPAGIGRTQTQPKKSLSTAGAAAASTNLITNWEDKLDEILSSETEDPAKAKQMLGLFPRLPEDGQVEVAQHLSNLVPDEDYGSLTNLLANASLPESVLDVLLSDALNRPNSLKMPTLLAVARDPKNPKASEAKDLLELFLEEDYGTDWNMWQAKVAQWLKENPD